MRLLLVGLILLAGVTTPTLAQRADTVERRVDRIEQELRAVQRRVFPNGTAQFAEPEIGAQAPINNGEGVPSGDALTNLNARVDALESQLRSLTSQVEEQGNRTNQLTEQVTRLRTELTGRIDRLEPPAAPAIEPPARPSPEPANSDADAPARPSGAAANSAEEAYNAGYRLWDQRHFAEAETALEAAATRFPTGRWISWIRNLQGRAYLDDNKPATAARILLANYQDNRGGERAADSLYYLGLALIRLNRRPEACRVYDELALVYPNMRDFIRTRLPQARTDARCTSSAAR